MTAMAAELTMSAIVNEDYGPPEQLRLEKVARPTIGDDQLLLRVRAASVNPFDWHLMRGEPYFVRLILGLHRPKSGGMLGVDAAGTVEAVGKDVTEFAPGDEVFGASRATFAEYATGLEQKFVAKPASLSFAEAAAIPGAGVTALQALRDHAGIEEGQTVLINGAAGGVGTFAVQISNAFGARTTGVCSSRNVDLVRSLGAEAIDYNAEDFTRGRQRYDVIVDNVGNRSLAAVRRALAPGGTLVVVGGKAGRLVGSMSRKLGAKMLDPLVGQRLTTFIAKLGKEDMVALKELIEAGKVWPVVGRTYPLGQAPDAIRYVESGHARGKVVITID